ncbi:hypothetical protein Xmau_02021 [Xenorhabdus mauleonii]|uniref:Uncharacterized protein n=1 Tax=Xenorhabdus mauleonii TaxID=351675 RepID=A0A1I3HUT0_9GAMM|nr:hypothetical protein Xmau_02021 [Xenorhabdus mauleonii]SFI39441.1 hypothetical protein SAMN05421680_10176 [Xenorhabdus mauleonii]
MLYSIITSAGEKNYEQGQFMPLLYGDGIE